MVDININVPTIDLTDVDLTDLDLTDIATEDTTPLSTIGMSDSQVATSLGLEYTGDRDQDQMVQDAVDQARRDTMMAEGTYPSEAEIAERTAQFEATMEQLRTDPAMREAWGIDRDTRRFSVSDILRIAASFAIPFASSAIVSALNLTGATANITQGALTAAFRAATGEDLSAGDVLGIGLSSSFGDIANAIETADKGVELIDTVQGLVDFIKRVDEEGRRPEDVLQDIVTEQAPPEEAISEDIVVPEDTLTQEEIDAAQAAMEDKLGATPQTQTLPDKTVVQEEEIVSLEPEPSLFGDTELTSGELQQIDYDRTVTEGPEFIRRQEDITKDAMRQALDDAGYTYDDAYIDKVYEDYGMNTRSVEEAQALTVQDWDLKNFTRDEVIAEFVRLGFDWEGQGVNPDDFVIAYDSQDPTTARMGSQGVSDYINENTTTTKEFYRIFSEIFGRAPTTEERAEYFGDENRIYTTTSEIQDTLEADFNADVDTTVQVEENGDPFFQPDVTYQETDGTVEVEDVGYEVTEPEVTFETVDAGGGGETSTTVKTPDETVDQTPDETVDQTADQAADDAIDDAISSTSDSELTSTTDDQGGGLADETTGTEDRPFAAPNGAWIYIGEGRWVLPDWDLIDEDSVIDNGDGTYSVPSDVYEDDSVWLRTATDPTWDPNNPEVFDAGDTGDIVGSGDPYEPEDQTVEEEGVDVFVDLFPDDTIDDGTKETTDTTVDTDGDNVPDNNDDLPDDPTESVDTDGDGVGDNADTDDDNDGTPDDSDANSTDPNTDGTGDTGGGSTVDQDGGSAGGDNGETTDPVVVDPGDGSGDQDGGEDDGTGPGTGPDDGTGDGGGGDDTPVVEPAAKPKGMLGQAAFTPYTGGAISPQLPGFVEVAYQPKDYMVELNRIIGESLFEGMY